MNRILSLFDWASIALLALGTAGHFYGTLKFYELGSALFVWSLSGVLAAALVVALNMLRRSRPRDRALALLALFASLCWMAIALLFGHSIHAYLDYRVVLHALAGACCAYFSARALIS